MRYYYPPKIGVNLSQGFDKFQQLDDTADDHLDSLLQTVIAFEERTGTKCEADVITVGCSLSFMDQELIFGKWRGMMTKVKDLWRHIENRLTDK